MTKIIINGCYGGFCVPQALCEKYGLRAYGDIERDDWRLVDFVEAQGGHYEEGRGCELRIVEIPDNATDWRIMEYDGIETVLMVIDGKIVEA